MSTALLTDHSGLTMLDAAIGSGVVDHEVVFELSAPLLPSGRRYGVVAGTGRIPDALGQFTFGDTELAYLREAGIASDRAVEWMSGFTLSGSIDSYREGEPFFPGSPVVTVQARFGEALLLETLLLSILNHDSAVASAAARMVSAAGGRPLIDVGGRRTHESAAVAAARASYVVGFASTSNLEAGRRYGIPTAGEVEPTDEYDLEATAVLGAGAPTSGFVFELVAMADSAHSDLLHPVEKISAEEVTRAGRQWAGRRKGADRRAEAEVIVPLSSVDEPDRPSDRLRPLQTPIVVAGEILPPPVLEDIRAHHQLALRDLGELVHDLSPGEPVIPTVRDL